MDAGKHDSVMAVHIYSMRAKAFDCKNVFCNFSGMVGSSTGWYPDALFPT